MKPHAPSRRHLLTGFLAGLFGSILTAKANGKLPLPPPLLASLPLP